MNWCHFFVILFFQHCKTWTTFSSSPLLLSCRKWMNSHNVPGMRSLLSMTSTSGPCSWTVESLVSLPYTTEEISLSSSTPLPSWSERTSSWRTRGDPDSKWRRGREGVWGWGSVIGVGMGEGEFEETVILLQPRFICALYMLGSRMKLGVVQNAFFIFKTNMESLIERAFRGYTNCAGFMICRVKELSFVSFFSTFFCLHWSAEFLQELIICLLH